MGQKVVRELVDDLDGSPAVQTVRFGHGDRDYEIDPPEEHATKPDKFLAPYLEHTRRVGDGT